MNKETTLLSILEKELTFFEQNELEEYGTVVRVFEGIAEVYGLGQVGYYEVVVFESGAKGVVLKLDEKSVYVALLNQKTAVLEKEIVRRTGSVLKIGVSDKMIGRIVDSLGAPIDNLQPIIPDAMMSIDRLAYGIVDRAPVNRSFETGFVAIDALIPIAKGQRELLVGDRSTGKTAVIIDTILHQKGKNVLCIYVSIGSKRANCAKIINLLEKEGAMSYTIVLEADANADPILQFLAPYSGCAIGEYFMDQGRDVFIAYDDLSNHAVAYRSLSLLLRRPPGREAFPGDIFYAHSRLLERACQLAPHKGGGSLTAMPVVETLGNDVSAYVPTNLISITDGQIIFDIHLFNQFTRPAINIGASVSRVGTLAQCKGMKKVQGVLKLDLAQFEELNNFVKFGSELNKTSRFFIDRGNAALEILKQNRGETYQCTWQIIFLVLLNEGVLDNFSSSIIKEFIIQFCSFFENTEAKTFNMIETSKDLTEENIKTIRNTAYKFLMFFREEKTSS